MKNKVMVLNKKKVVIAVLLFFVVISLIAGSIIGYNLSSVSNKKTAVTIKIKENETGIEVIKDLEKKDLIRSSFVFKVYMKLNGEINFEPGTYILYKNESTPKIYKRFKKRDFVDTSRNVTIKEGKNIEAIGEIIAKNTTYTKKEFIDLVSNKEFVTSLMKDYPFITKAVLNDKIYYDLEGYLFPDTYKIDNNTTLEMIVRMMLDREKKELDKYEKNIKSSKYSIHELLTLASIVELEGSNKEDRINIASVFYNRLKINMSLGSDPTTYYAVKKKIGEPLKQSELDSDNPYNTRNIYNKGIPVGPICNPGSDALLATLSPASTDYLYFVADNTGKTYFTRNSSEHNAIISKLQREGKF